MYFLVLLLGVMAGYAIRALLFEATYKEIYINSEDWDLWRNDD